MDPLRLIHPTGRARDWGVPFLVCLNDLEIETLSNYRRVVVPGGCFFFTVVTYHRRPIFTIDLAVNRLRDGFRRVMMKWPFQVDAIVVLPDHLHCIWRLPEGDNDYATRWRLIKHHLARYFLGVEGDLFLRNAVIGGENKNSFFLDRGRHTILNLG